MSVQKRKYFTRIKHFYIFHYKKLESIANIADLYISIYIRLYFTRIKHFCIFVYKNWTSAGNFV